MGITLKAGTQAPAEIIAALPVVRALLSGDVADKLPDVKQVDVNAAGEVGLTLADGSQLRLGTTDRPRPEVERCCRQLIERYLKDGKQVGVRRRERADAAGCQAQMNVVWCFLAGMCGVCTYCSNEQSVNQGLRALA